MVGCSSLKDSFTLPPAFVLTLLVRFSNLPFTRRVATSATYHPYPFIIVPYTLLDQLHSLHVSFLATLCILSSIIIPSLLLVRPLPEPLQILFVLNKADCLHIFSPSFTIPSLVKHGPCRVRSYLKYPLFFILFYVILVPVLVTSSRRSPGYTLTGRCRVHSPWYQSKDVCFHSTSILIGIFNQ
ncbi:hypothetical protein F5051DRAFT_223870 [Lentinula edodes]|nr:hypothetical protein F5051DRAFT_223870 [Lentinula edodes]